MMACMQSQFQIHFTKLVKILYYYLYIIIVQLKFSIFTNKTVQTFNILQIISITRNNKIKFKSGLHLTMTHIYIYSITFLVTWFIHQLVVSEVVHLLDSAALRMAGLVQFRLFVVLQS